MGTIPVAAELAALTKSMVAFAWGWMAFGIFVGLIIGMWSFDGPAPTPAIVGDYDSCARRLIRLGHVAFIMLPLISMSYAVHILDTSLTPDNKMLAVKLMWFGMIGVPVTCMSGAFVRPTKYLMSFPAISVFVCLTMMAVGKQ
jgi:hypothetical protein